LRRNPELELGVAVDVESVEKRAFIKADGLVGFSLARRALEIEDVGRDFVEVQSDIGSPEKQPVDPEHLTDVV
jgi:hypothetical protein